MAKVIYDCLECGKEASFDTQVTTQILLDDAIKRSNNYIVSCQHCGFESVIELDQ